MLTQTSKSQKSFNNDPPQRSQKSRSRLHLQKTPSMVHLQKTPSMVMPKTASMVMPNNPYVQQLGDRSTSKKRRDNSVSFVPPILLDQNKQLLTQNRQMATMIQEKNAAIDALQAKLDRRAEAEIAIFREVEAEKKRLIQQILAHKQATDQQMAALAQEVSTVQQEKASLQRQFQMQLKKRELALQQQRQKEMEQVRLQHQQAFAVLKAENAKVKDQAQRRANENQIRELQSKQKINEANSRCEWLTQELKHLQQVRRLQQAQQKTHFQARIQKLHLQNRRQKELFLIEHESQVSRLQEEGKRLRGAVQDLEAARRDLRESMEVQKAQKEDYQEKVQYEAEASIDHIKRVTIAERQKMEGLLKTEIALLQGSNQQEVAHLQGENRRLAELVDLKQREIQRLLREIDELRQGRWAQLQQNQKLVRELQSRLLNSLLEGETENQALKTKLARLREADLTGLRNYYQNQIQLLARGLQEKETALSALREKQQEQLRKKIEMRKGFDLETLRYKSRIIQLQNQIQSLTAKVKQADDAMRRQAETAVHQAQRETSSRAKTQQLKSDQCKQLRAMITAKDGEIEQLTRRLELLKEHHALQRTGWHSELEAEKNLHQLTKAEKVKVADTFEGELAKLKEKGRKERQQFERDLQMLKEEHRGDFDSVITQLAAQRQLNEEERQGLLLQLRRKELQIQKLSNLLASRQKDIQTLQNTKREQIIADLSKERTQLQDFYASKLKLKQEQAIDLLQRIEELASDLRDARQNYNDLQRRMQQLIQSQSQLREVQRKVMLMGKENSLVKNMQQILQQSK